MDSSGSDSDLDMPMGSMMSGPNSQSTSKGSHHNMTANLQHNLLLQQGLNNSQLGEKIADNGSMKSKSDVKCFQDKCLKDIRRQPAIIYTTSRHRFITMRWMHIRIYDFKFVNSFLQLLSIRRGSNLEKLD